MGARNIMRSRCDIRLSSRASADNWGDDVAAALVVVLDEVPCHFWFEKVERYVIDGRRVDITRRKLVVPLDTVVDEQATVVSVRDAENNEIADGPMKVVAVGRRRDHLVLDLEDIR